MPSNAVKRRHRKNAASDEELLKYAIASSNRPNGLVVVVLCWVLGSATCILVATGILVTVLQDVLAQLGLSPPWSISSQWLLLPEELWQLPLMGIPITIVVGCVHWVSLQLYLNN